MFLSILVIFVRFTVFCGKFLESMMKCDTYSFFDADKAMQSGISLLPAASFCQRHHFASGIIL